MAATTVTASISSALDNITSALTKTILGQLEEEFAARIQTMHRAKAPAKASAKKEDAHVSSYKPTIARWVPDIHARRVPTFVIEMTGLDTKKAIVARYGDSAVFELGKPAPKPLA